MWLQSEQNSPITFSSSFHAVKGTDKTDRKDKELGFDFGLEVPLVSLLVELSDPLGGFLWLAGLVLSESIMEQSVYKGNCARGTIV